MMLFSFIIPIYNVDRTLVCKCLDSICEQSYNNIEIIIINDGSTLDIGLDYIFKLKENNKIKYYYQENMGVSIARNNGINNSSGDYIIFVDPDDYISTDLCENMRIYLNDNRNVDIVLFKYTKNKNLLGTIRNENYISFENVDYNELELNILSQNEPYQDYSIGAPWGKVFKKNFLINNKLFFKKNVQKSQDRLFMLYLLEKQPLIGNVCFCGYYYNFNENSICNKYNPNIYNILKKTLNEMEKYIEIYHEKEYAYKQAYWNLCIQYFLLILRLDIYNKMNTLKDIDKREIVKKLTLEYPFNYAFRKVNLKQLGLRRKIVVILVRLHLVDIIKFII